MRMNKTVREAIHTRYRTMLEQGCFPEVGWSRNGTYEYNTFQYLQFWARLAFLVDANLKRLNYTLGCYELKRSDAFRNDVMAILRTITPEMVVDSPGVLGVPR